MNVKNSYERNLELWASLKTLFEAKLAGYAVCVVKPPRKAYSLASSAFLAADAPYQFSLFKPVFREALMITDSFDGNSEAIINPYVNENAPQVDACILTFSDKIEHAVLQNYDCKEIGRFHCATRETPVYLIEHNGGKFAFYKTMIGAPACVGTVEDSFAVIRTKRYVVFGGAGCLDKKIAHGKVMVPTYAYRDEGTSYHYAPPSDYIEGISKNRFEKGKSVGCVGC